MSSSYSGRNFHAANEVPSSVQNGVQERIFTISRFSSESDSTPRQVMLSWPEMVSLLTHHTPRLQKRGSQAWSPVTYAAGMTRGKNNVLAIGMLVFDVDNGVRSAMAVKQLDGLAYVIHSSFSHTDAHPKYRIVIPLSEPVPASEWASVWERANRWMGGLNDPATKDASRLYFLPTCPPDSTAHFSSQGLGRFLNCNELPELPTLAKSTSCEAVVNFEQDLISTDNGYRYRLSCFRVPRAMRSKIDAATAATTIFSASQEAGVIWSPFNYYAVLIPMTNG